MPGTFTYARSTNTLTVTNGTSGSPADFASMLAADRAGSVELLAAWTPTSNTKALTYQVAPAEVLALLISFIIASKTTEADYIFITGTDAWGAAQTESIDVSDGNGTYVSTKRFKTITNIDCSDNAAGGGTVWANGTVRVTQPQWGVVWNPTQNNYLQGCKIVFGDGTTPTYFADNKATITLLSSVPTGSWEVINTIEANTTVVFGEIVDVDTMQSKNGCVFVTLDTNASNFLFYAKSGSKYEFYSCFFLGLNYNNLYAITGEHVTSASRIWNTSASGMGLFLLSSSTSIYRGNFQNGIGVVNCKSEFDDLSITATVAAVEADGSQQVVLYNSTLKSAVTFTTYLLSVDCFMRNCIAVPAWTVNIYDGSSGKLFREYSVSLMIVDVNNSGIENASIVIQDKDSNIIASGTTDADGNFSEWVTFKLYAYQTVETFSPHKLTISKAGYETLIIPEITMDEKINWTLELKRIQHPIAPWEDCR